MGGYEPFYRDFDLPVMRRLRQDAYGEDIGQHSWVGADEVREDVRRLGLVKSSRLLDLGCGPCGPLTYILSTVGCSGSGLELNSSAVLAGRARAIALGVADRLAVQEADLNEPLPFEGDSFDAALSLDVVLHVGDRGALFREIARVVRPRGRFLLTDAGVVTGCVSNEAIRRRSVHGFTQFVPPGWNESQLEAAGFRVLESENRNATLLRNARGRQAALRAHRLELETLMGAALLEAQCEYLDIVVELAQQGALSRVMVLAEVMPR
jgi:cyclopropane fatty-acyl-phospholipid synthase-like methyltransferase